MVEGHGLSACSDVGGAMCDDGHLCCCPPRYLWSRSAEKCVSCKVSVLGHKPGFSSVSLSVTPRFNTSITCLALRDGNELRNRLEIEQAEVRSVVEACLPGDGCKVSLQGLAPGTTYRVWCLTDASGIEDISPQAGLIIATHAVPLRWKPDDSGTRHDELRISVQPHIPCNVVCIAMRKDADVETERHVQSYCEEEGCNITIGRLPSDRDYELHCGSSIANARLTDAQFAHTMAAPIQQLRVEAVSAHSLVVHFRLDGSSQVSCAAFMSDAADETERESSRRGSRRIVRKAVDEAVRVDMISHAAFWQDRRCAADERCRITLSPLSSDTEYLVSCATAGASDDEVVPSRGASATTWPRLPLSSRERSWATVLSVGVYLLVASIVLAAAIGSCHQERNCAFQGARAISLPLKPGEPVFVGGWYGSFVFESFRAVGVLHLIGLVLYFSVGLPIWAAFAFHEGQA